MPPFDAGNSLRRCCSLMLVFRSVSLIARRSCTPIHLSAIAVGEALAEDGDADNITQV